MCSVLQRTVQRLGISKRIVTARKTEESLNENYIMTKTNSQKNKIYNTDCLEFMKTYDGKRVDLVLTSPPYNMTNRPGGDADSGRYDEYDDWKDMQSI
jgi:DNA modification methylase